MLLVIILMIVALGLIIAFIIGSCKIASDCDDWFNYDALSPVLISEEEKCMEKTLVCCLCGKIIDDPYGHNPYPLSVNEEDRCCAECNGTKVIPARIAKIRPELVKEDSKEESE